MLASITNNLTALVCLILGVDAICLSAGHEESDRADDVLISISVELFICSYVLLSRLETNFGTTIVRSRHVPCWIK